MNFLPAPLDNPFVLIAVIIGLVILAIGMKRSRDAKAQLEQTRKDKAKAKAKRIRDAKAIEVGKDGPD